MGYVIREIYPTGGHTVCNPSGDPIVFSNEKEAEKMASSMNLTKRDVTRLFVVIPNRYSI